VSNETQTNDVVSFPPWLIAVCLVAGILGLQGVFNGCLGAISLGTLNWFMQTPAGMPPELTTAYDNMRIALQQLRWWLIPLTLSMGVASVILTIGVFRAIMRMPKAGKWLTVGLYASLAIDALSGISEVVITLWLWPTISALTDIATQVPPGALSPEEQMMIESMPSMVGGFTAVGMSCGFAILALKIAYYIAALRYIKRPHIRQFLKQDKGSG